MSRPTVHYDPQSDVLYFLVRDGDEERFVEVAEGVNVELDQEGQLLGVEIMNASRFLRAAIGPERLAQFAIQATMHEDRGDTGTRRPAKA